MGEKLKGYRLCVLHRNGESTAVEIKKVRQQKRRTLNIITINFKFSRDVTVMTKSTSKIGWLTSVRVDAVPHI